jgi:hypothetical protein
MAAGRLPTTPSGDSEKLNLGNKIIIDKLDDPTQAFEIKIFGEWTHRQVLSINYQLMRAFRSHMSTLRREGINEKEKGDVD